MPPRANRASSNKSSSSNSAPTVAAAIPTPSARTAIDQEQGRNIAELMEAHFLRTELVDPFKIVPGSQIRKIRPAGVEKLKQSILQSGFMLVSGLVVLMLHNA